MTRVLLISCFILIRLAVLAQSDTIMIIHSFKQDQGMQFKWLPTSYPVFLEGFRSGYNIYRAEVVKENGGEKALSFEKLNPELLKYWTVERLQKEVKKDSNLIPAGLFVEGAEEMLNRPPAQTPKEAVERAEGDDFLHMLGSFVTIADNKMAEALGLYFVDRSLNPQKKYLYKIEIPGKTGFTGHVVYYPESKSQGSKVMGLTTTLYPGAIYLSWYNNANRDFPYYNIYRSEKKNGPFIKLNSIPFVGEAGNAKINKRTTGFTDSIPVYNKTYYYKVAGINAFQEEGIHSEVIEIKAYYLLKSGAVIHETTSPDNKNIKLSWAVDPEDKPYIKGFAIYRAKKGSGPYRKIHKDLLPGTIQNYTDNTSKGSSNYYVVTTFGHAGDSINSLLKAHLLVDSFPPAKPVMISGICDTNGVVTLVWKNNKEEDMKGYRVFKAYQPGQEPERVTASHVTDTTLTDTLNLKEAYNKIYYRIVAVDDHFNSSIPSAFLEVPLPDKNRPQSGFLKSYSVGMKGINLSWVPGASSDMKTLTLYRKAELDYDYKPILTLQGDSLKITSYTDTTAESGMIYSYALRTRDESGLWSEYSAAFVIEQRQKINTSSVSNLKAIVSKENKMVKLSWEFPENAKGFRIFRARNGEPISTYQVVTGDKREYYDKWLKPRSKYTYLIIADLPGGFTSGYSNQIEVKY